MIGVSDLPLLPTASRWEAYLCFNKRSVKKDVVRETVVDDVT